MPHTHARSFVGRARFNSFLFVAPRCPSLEFRLFHCFYHGTPGHLFNISATSWQLLCNSLLHLLALRLLCNFSLDNFRSYFSLFASHSFSTFLHLFCNFFAASLPLVRTFRPLIRPFNAVTQSNLMHDASNEARAPPELLSETECCAE